MVKILRRSGNVDGLTFSKEMKEHLGVSTADPKFVSVEFTKRAIIIRKPTAAQLAEYQQLQKNKKEK